MWYCVHIFKVGSLINELISRVNLRVRAPVYDTTQGRIHLKYHLSNDLKVFWSKKHKVFVPPIFKSLQFLSQTFPGLLFHFLLLNKYLNWKNNISILLDR